VLATAIMSIQSTSVGVQHSSARPSVQQGNTFK